MTNETIRHGSVNDITDEELLRRAMRTCRPAGARIRAPRWVAVMDTFLLGSTYSHQLCRRFGVDPDELVRR
jgi:hypothetical protein